MQLAHKRTAKKTKAGPQGFSSTRKGIAMGNAISDERHRPFPFRMSQRLQACLLIT